MVDLESEKVGARPAGQPRATTHPTRGPDAGPLVFQELFSKQKGYLDEELDYRIGSGHEGSVWSPTGPPHLFLSALRLKQPGPWPGGVSSVTGHSHYI